MEGSASSERMTVGLAAISKLTALSERSIAIGVAISAGVAIGIGEAPFMIGVIADHFTFHVGVFGLGVLTVFSSFGVNLQRKS